MKSPYWEQMDNKDKAVHVISCVVKALLGLFLLTLGAVAIIFSAGAFIEFNGKLSVMCVSLAAATVYAVGQVTLRISADTIKGPALYM